MTMYVCILIDVKKWVWLLLCVVNLWGLSWWGPSEQWGGVLGGSSEQWGGVLGGPRNSGVVFWAVLGTAGWCSVVFGSCFWGVWVVVFWAS